MGLGKTVQTIGFLCHLRNAGHINGPYMVRGSGPGGGRMARVQRMGLRHWALGACSRHARMKPMRQLLCDPVSQSASLCPAMHPPSGAPATLRCAGAGPAVHADQLGQRV